MKLLATIAVIPLVMAGSGPVLAQASTDKQASASNERRVCRSREVTGSNIRARRVCLTESQWRQRDQLDRERVEDFANRNNQACRPSSDGSSCQ